MLGARFRNKLDVEGALTAVADVLLEFIKDNQAARHLTVNLQESLDGIEHLLVREAGILIKRGELSLERRPHLRGR